MMCLGVLYLLSCLNRHCCVYSEFLNLKIGIFHLCWKLSAIISSYITSASLSLILLGLQFHMDMLDHLCPSCLLHSGLALSILHSHGPSVQMSSIDLSLIHQTCPFTIKPSQKILSFRHVFQF